MEILFIILFILVLVYHIWIMNTINKKIEGQLNLGAMLTLML